MRVALLTREYPPEVYGGAGVHVEYLARELARLEELTVHCWGAERARRRRRASRTGRGTRSRAASRTWRRCRRCRSTSRWPPAWQGAELVHSHTWYANLAGHLAKLIYGIPHVATVHSPRAAAAVEGGAARRRLRALVLLRARSALEGADAVIAVSEGMRARHPRRLSRRSTPARVRGDLQRHRRRASTAPDRGTDVLERHGVDPARRRSCSSGGSRARRASRTCSTRRSSSTRGAQLVLCAGAPDTPEIGAEVERRVERLREERGNVIWLDQMLPKPEVIQLLSHATVFVCPSIYEPLGIVNLEAMACEAAVVATATGGIVEVVRGRRHGPARAVRAGPDGAIEPRDPEGVRRRRSPSGSTSCWRDPSARASDGPRRPGAGGRGVRLVRDRRADGLRSTARWSEALQLRIERVRVCARRRV